MPANVKIVGGTILKAGYKKIAPNSGGTQLSLDPISFVKVVNISGNDSMWTGPFGISSGNGYLLLANNVNEIHINDLQKVYASAQTSGQIISFRSEA